MQPLRAQVYETEKFTALNWLRKEHLSKSSWDWNWSLGKSRLTLMTMMLLSNEIIMSMMGADLFPSPCDPLLFAYLPDSFPLNAVHGTHSLGFRCQHWWWFGRMERDGYQLCCKIAFPNASEAQLTASTVDQVPDWWRRGETGWERWFLVFTLF